MRIAEVLLVLSCLNTIHVDGQMAGGSSALPHVLVYKTKNKYRNLVPVELSEDKKSIASYPSPGDLKTRAGYLTPVLLHGGYLLDRTGVSVHTAFIRLSYMEYGKLQNGLTPEELYKMIIDKSPIKELCDCGVRGEANSVKELNALIDKNALYKKCKKLK